MADIKAKISSNTQSITAKTNRYAPGIAAKTVQVQAGQVKLGDLGDVDSSGQSDGAMLIFNATTGKYEVKTEIQNENLNIIGGTY